MRLVILAFLLSGCIPENLTLITVKDTIARESLGGSHCVGGELNELNDEQLEIKLYCIHKARTNQGLQWTRYTWWDK